MTWPRISRSLIPAALFLLAGCFRGGFERSPADGPVSDLWDSTTADAGPLAPDTRADADAGVDVGDACVLPSPVVGPAPSGPFGEPALLTTLNSTSAEDDPTLTADRLEIYFESTRNGSPRLWRSVRSTVNDPWPAPVLVQELAGRRANTPRISRDGLTLRFADSGPLGESDIYVTTRQDRSSPWSPPVVEQALSSGSSDTGAVTFLDGKGVVLFSNRPGGLGNGDLWLAVREGPGCAVWSAVQPLGGVNTVDSEANPWIRNDGLMVVFQAGYAEGTGAGDLYVATRSSLGAPFGAAVELAELDSGATDDDPWLSDDARVIYFSSARTGDVELYRATR